MVMSLPAGTRFMMASTSRGAGMATVPVPNCLRIFGPTGTDLGEVLVVERAFHAMFFVCT